MSISNLLIAPEYLSFYIAGRKDVRIPLDLEQRKIASNSRCITVPCLYWNDGDTSVTIGSFEELAQRSTPDFDGTLETPDRIVILFDANEPDFATVPVTSTKTRIRIWVDHPTEPENVVIAWS